MTASYNIGPENFEVFSDSEIVWMGEAIYDGSAAIYIPCAMANGQMGYCVRSVDGNQSEFLYLNPSTDSQGEPNVFVYKGESNDPAHDPPLHHYRVAELFTPPQLTVDFPDTLAAREAFTDDEMTEFGPLYGPLLARLRELHELIEQDTTITLARDRENCIFGLVLGDRRFDVLAFTEDGRVGHGGVNQPVYFHTFSELLDQ